MLSEVRGKVTPSSSSVRGSKGKTEKPVEGPPAPHAEPKGPRKLSAVPVTKDDADPCHDGLSPRCTPPTSKPVEHRVQRSLADVPTKSPSSGLHKPTWKPSSKPAENAMEATLMTNANPTLEPPSTIAAAPKSAMTSSAKASSATTTSSEAREAGPKGASKKLAHDGQPARSLVANQATTSTPLATHTATSAMTATAEAAGVPTKSPSSGLHKPTWKPSSKPAENAMEATLMTAVNPTLTREAGPKGAAKTLAHDGTKPARTLAAGLASKDDADPCHDGLSPRCTPPTSKPVEHASKQAAALPRTLSAVPVKVTKDDADPCHDGLSPRCTPPTSKPVEHASKQAAALPRTLSAVPVKVTKDDADPCHDGLSPRCTPPTSKPVEHRVQRSLAGSPTKSPSSGLHKPTWKPSSKPNEHRELVGGVFTQVAGSSATKNGGASNGHAVVKMRSSANTPPSKSPSAGLHKPTWKPSSKPAENAMESTAMESSVTDTIATEATTTVSA